MNKTKMKIKEIIEKGFFHIFIGNILIKIITFISSIAIVRILTKTSYAYLEYANNLYAYVILVSGFGLSSALLKFGSSIVNENEQQAYLKYASKIGFIIQLILSLIVLFYTLFFNIVFKEAIFVLLILVFYPPLLYLFETYMNYLRTKLENKKYIIYALIQASITVLLSITGAIFFKEIGVAIFRILSIIIVLILIYLFSGTKKTDCIEKYVLTKKQINEFQKVGFSIMIATLFSTMMSINEMYLVINLIKDEVLISNYKVANLIPSQITFITGSIMIFYFPIIAKLKNNKIIFKTVLRVQAFNLIIILIVGITGYIITPLIIKVFYGDQYNQIIGISRLFWVSYTINAGFRMVPLNVIPALGRFRFNIIITVITGLLHLLLSYFSIKTFGVNGAVYSTLFIYFITSFIYWVYLFIITKRKKLANLIYGDNNDVQI